MNFPFIKKRPDYIVDPVPVESHAPESGFHVKQGARRKGEKIACDVDVLYSSTDQVCNNRKANHSLF